VELYPCSFLTFVLDRRECLLLGLHRSPDRLAELASECGRSGEVSASDRICISRYCTPCGSVCAVTGARAGGSGVRFLAGTIRDFRLLLNIQNGSGVLNRLVSGYRGPLSLRVKRPRREADHFIYC